MANPILPGWEYIPDGEPRVFGDRVYLYGSHDRPGSKRFCDYKLRVWSAPLDDLENWVCHGDVFHTRPDEEHPSSVDWTTNELYAPDVVEKDGKYYLYFYILMAHGGVAVSDSPAGPFTLLSKYAFRVPKGAPDNYCDQGIFVDPGVLVDDDGRTYIYCGYLRSYMAELNADNMFEVIDGSFQEHIIPEADFFEACSPRKVGDTYYLIYSPKIGSRLDYATSASPTGPFRLRGTIIDNGVEYPGGNDHGSICRIGDQWYIFYHRMTNNTCQSRRACVERIKMLPDGSIPQVEMTSLGFSAALSPYRPTPADQACVLVGGGYITELDPALRAIVENRNGSIFGFKYFEFGPSNANKYIRLSMTLRPVEPSGSIAVLLDSYRPGEALARIDITDRMAPLAWTTVTVDIPSITGRHALYFRFEGAATDTQRIADVASFVFTIANPMGEVQD